MRSIATLGGNECVLAGLFVTGIDDFSYEENRARVILPNHEQERPVNDHAETVSHTGCTGHDGYRSCFSTLLVHLYICLVFDPADEDIKVLTWIIENHFRFHQFYGNVCAGLGLSALLVVLGQKCWWVVVLFVAALVCLAAACCAYLDTSKRLEEFRCNLERRNSRDEGGDKEP